MLWRGPVKDGITQSLLGQFLSCRERFKLRVIDGLEADASFDVRLEYGNMFHACEEARLGGKDWQEVLLQYAKGLADKYPLQSHEIAKWYNVCKVQYPLYLSYYGSYLDEAKSVLQEYSFRVQYEIAPNRYVTLRGKFDAVNLIDNVIYLQENKTKSEIDEQTLLRQLSFDLQTCFYLVAMREMHDKGELLNFKTYTLAPSDIVEIRHVIGGVDYNVIKRPLSGGKGTIVRHKPTKSNPAGESEEEYYARLAGIIREDLPSYFWRSRVLISSQEIETFEESFLKPILNQLYDWWLYQSKGTKKYKNSHYRTPYGVYLPLMEERNSYLDNYLETGETYGLRPIQTLFPEL